jgi:hypothetical protein
MVLPPDSIASAVDPINSMQVARDFALFANVFLIFFLSISARLKDSVFEVREKALAALRGKLFRHNNPVVVMCSHLTCFSHPALLQHRPKVGLPVFLSIATAGDSVEHLIAKVPC